MEKKTSSFANSVQMCSFIRVHSEIQNLNFIVIFFLLLSPVVCIRSFLISISWMQIDVKIQLHHSTNNMILLVKN